MGEQKKKGKKVHCNKRYGRCEDVSERDLLIEVVTDDGNG